MFLSLRILGFGAPWCLKLNSHLSVVFLLRDARNMAKDVQTALYEIAEEMEGMTRTQATDYIKKLMTKGRYSQDVWS